MNDLFTLLLNESLANSQFEESRNYVSLSNIFKPVEHLVKDFKEGYTSDDAGKLKCRLGYWMEKGMKERLLKLPDIEDSYSIVVPNSNNLINGHPDFKFKGCPGDCKSYLLDEHLPEFNKIPRKIYWQMNGYMLYTNTYQSYLVCESRESGRFKVITVKRNEAICNSILIKVEEIKSIIL